MFDIFSRPFRERLRLYRRRCQRDILRALDGDA